MSKLENVTPVVVLLIIVSMGIWTYYYFNKQNRIFNYCSSVVSRIDIYKLDPYPTGENLKIYKYCKPIYNQTEAKYKKRRTKRNLETKKFIMEEIK